MVIIKCVTDESGNQYLPHFVDTPLFAEEDLCSLTKRQEQLLVLYKAIADRENYWYTNKPTAFGNPEFSMASGIVTGMVAGLGWDYQEVDGWIIIKVKSRVVLKIQKPQKSHGYWAAVKENSEVLAELGL